ncbi:MAG: CRTAC1 family protein [Acidobacteria bacterium]|nr:CRTAC1 family protein [Acidobacteriota bacterium]
MRIERLLQANILRLNQARRRVLRRAFGLWPFTFCLLLFAFLLLPSGWLPSAQTANGGVRFTDITKSAGLTFKHRSSPEKRYIVESMSGGVALFDYDNDGWLDIYLVNSLTMEALQSATPAPSELYHNNGDGTFTNVTATAGVGAVGWGMGVCVGDYNNDGWDDLYVTCLGPNHLLKNNGNGTFTDVTTSADVKDPRWSTGAAFVDYDNDGYLDLFVANYVDFDIHKLPVNERPCRYRGIEVQCGPRGLRGAGDTLYHNNGDGTFTDVSVKAGVADPQGYYGLGVVCSDFDGDGWVDIFVANDATPNFLYHNNGDGTFKDLGFVSGAAVNENGGEQACMGVTVGDYDHDGRFDLFATNFSQEYNVLYRSTGKNLFTDSSYAAKVAEASLPYVGWGTKFFDYDNDGWLDLFVANGHVYPQVDQAGLDAGYRQRKLLHKNNRDGTFTEIAAQCGDALMEKRVSRGVAFGDIDNDGDVDMIVNDLDGAPQLLRNDGGNANHALLIKTLGTTCNRDGIGARVKVVSGDLTQVDEVRSGASYLSHHDLRLHFGLEKRTKIDLVEIRWPDGRLEKLEGLGVNRIIVVKEGKGVIEQTAFNRAAAK